MPSHAKESGVWKEIGDKFIKQSGVWKTLDESFNKESGVWKSNFIAAFVVAPSLTVEGASSSVPETPTLSGSSFEVDGDTDTHVQTDWEVRDTNDNLIWSKTETN